MRHVIQDQLYISRNGSLHAIGPADPGVRAYHEALIAEDYASCHPGDSIEGLKRRARFTKEDKGLLMDWMARAAVKAEQLAESRAAQPHALRQVENECPAFPRDLYSLGLKQTTQKPVRPVAGRRSCA